MKLNESSDVLEGFLIVDRIWNDGRTERLVEEKNLIVRAAKREHLSFLYDPNAKVNRIDSFKIGNGGCYDSLGRKPKRPDPTLNDLYNPIITYNRNLSITPSALTDAQDYITVDFVLGPAEANGENISEVGLFKESGDMFNIKTFRAVPKVDSFSLQFWWRILYA
jgi:hypothetical protein